MANVDYSGSPSRASRTVGRRPYRPTFRMVAPPVDRSDWGWGVPAVISAGAAAAVAYPFLRPLFDRWRSRGQYVFHPDDARRLAFFALQEYRDFQAEHPELAPEYRDEKEQYYSDDDF